MAIDIAFLQSEQTLIPFLFVLAIVFGVLELTGIFKNRGVNFIVALAIAFFTITNAAFVALLWSQFGNITAFFIIMFFLAFVFEVFGLRRPKPGSKGEEGMFINGAILALLLVFGFANVSLLPILPFVGGGSNLIAIVALVFILAIFWMAFKVGREEPSGQPTGQKK